MYIKTRITNEKEDYIFCDIEYQNGQQGKIDYCKATIFHDGNLSRKALYDILDFMENNGIDGIDEIEIKQKPTIF